VIDLHTHSNYSDGSFSPAELAEAAAAIGLSTIALTDHDTTASHDDMQAACDAVGIDLIVGAEISLVDNEWKPNGATKGRGVHVLAYFLPLDPTSPIQMFLQHLRDDRIARNRHLVDILQGYGFEKLTMEYLIGQVANPDGIGRPHIAEAMFALHPEIMGERTEAAFNQVFVDWLGSRGKAYLPKTELTIEMAVEAAKGSGTVFSVAHPLLNYLDGYSADNVEWHMPGIIRSLKERGFAGIEAYYGSSSAATRAHMVKLTRDAGMIPTGGSDFHGSFKPSVKLGVGFSGDLHVPDDIAEELRSASSR